MTTKSMTKSQFRALVLLSLILGLIGSLLDLVVPSLIPDAIQKAQVEYDAAMSMFRLSVVVLLVIAGLGLSFVAMYGLYRFSRWAPRLAIIGTVISLLALSAIGFTSQSRFASAFISISTSLWGGVVVLCYVDPYRVWFQDEAK